MGATLLRQWLVLSLLPRPPRRIDTGVIEARLRERGVDVHRRTIQRDLVELAGVFPIVSDERAKPYAWRWADDASFAAWVSAPAPLNTTQAPRVTLTLRGSPAGVRELVACLGAGPANVLDGAPVVTALVTVADSPAARRRLLAYADEVELVEPLELRRHLAERARRALALQDGVPPGRT